MVKNVTAADIEAARAGEQPHFHRDERGFLVKCYHKTKVLFSWQFWIGLTLGFPLEHLLWEKVWPFYELTHLIRHLH